MSEQAETSLDGRPLVTLAEAAAATGRHPEALRGMVRRGRLAAVRGNDGRLLVRLPVDQAAGQKPGDNRPEAGLLEEVAEVREEAAGLRVALARAETERDAAKAVATAETEMLRGALTREQARADRLEARLALPPGGVGWSVEPGPGSTSDNAAFWQGRRSGLQAARQPVRPEPAGSAGDDLP